MKNLQKGFIMPVLLVIIALLMIGGGVYVYENKKVEVPAVVDNTQTSPPVPTPTLTPTPTPKPIPKPSPEPEFKNATSYSTGGAGYQCSKPIKLRRERKLVVHMMGSSWETLYLPVDPDEAKLFCHGTWIEEYKGKITVLQKPEVLGLISRYQHKDVSIKALEFELLHSEGFADRLLPQYKGREIGCVIILETPNEKMVFLEDENLETFEQMDYRLFDKQLDQVSPADKQLFLENLR